MNPSNILTVTVRRPAFRLGAAVLAGFALLGGSLSAKTPVPENLSGGLGDLVKSRYELKQSKAAGQKMQSVAAATGIKFSSQVAADIANDSLTDDTGRVMVMIHLSGLNTFKETRKAVKAIPSLTITAVDKTYKGGVIEGYVSVDDVADLAEVAGVRSVALEAKPEHNRRIAQATSGPVTDVVTGQTLTLLGTAFDQGVTQHRVDTINKFYSTTATVDYEGQGMQIGYISDSFGSATTVTSPATDMANYDLPGSSTNPAGNTQPVVVLQDFGVAAGGTGGTDEGRAMVQIGYKMAPKARLAFATADNGEVGFGNNIRALAGLSNFTYPAATQQGFAADTICDDVGYQDEPFFEDGIVGNAVDDVAAAGVAYFSSAGNDIGTYDYDSDFRYVPNGGTGLTAATNAALTGTNINLANVPTNLYQGGFHNFNPAGQDVAQTVNVVAGTALPVTNFQWNDPYNQTVTVVQPPLSFAPGNIAANSGASQTFTTPSLTAGSFYAIEETADSGSTFDGIVTVTDPTGTVVVNAQDTGTDETIAFTPSVTGVYTITVSAFGTTGGAYHVGVYTAVAGPQLSTDFNILVFDTAGNYLPASSLVANNYSTNVPYDAKRTSPATGQTQVQYVISRSTIPTITPVADHFRWIIRGNGAAGIGPAEYFTVNTPNTKGHAMARGCNGTAAYSVFRPSIPEYYTSPGPVTVYLDKQGNRLTTPEIRLQPGVAAADAANTSFFASDSTSDIDTKPNFGGTSAAAPHAATIAALVIQAHGGPRSLTPAQVTSILHSTAFPHDLDPNAATGVAKVTGTSSGKLTITAISDRGLNPSSGAFNPNSIAVSYVGSGSVATLTFNPGGTAATAGNTTGGNNGVDATNTYFDNVYPGLVFEPNTVPFTVGNAGAPTLAGTTAVFSNLAPAPSNQANQYFTMALTFPTTAFTGGKVFDFTVGHAPQHDSTVSNGTGPTNGLTATASTQADLFGGTVLLPEGTGNGNGMSFSGTMTDGTAFTGTMKNNIGAGYSKLDGYGFINAQAAVAAPAP